MEVITPFLTFETDAKNAMELYVNTFPDAKIIKDLKYPNNNELVLQGEITIKGQKLYFLDLGEENKVEKGWNISLLYEVHSEEEFHSIYDKLKVNGSTMMGPEKVDGFNLVTWVIDQYGITWQIVYPV